VTTSTSGCFPHLFSAGGNTARRFGVPSCTASLTPAHSVGPRGRHAHRCARRRSNDDPQRTRRRKWRSGRNLRFAPQLLLAPPLRRRLRPRDRKRQPIAAAYAFRLPLRAQPRLSTLTLLQPQAVVPLATITCSSAIDEKKWVRGAVTTATNDPNSAACKRHAGQTSDSGCARSSRRSRRGSGAG
jgi:hypothetical protein